MIRSLLLLVPALLLVTAACASQSSHHGPAETAGSHEHAAGEAEAHAHDHAQEEKDSHAHDHAHGEEDGHAHDHEQTGAQAPVSDSGLNVVQTEMLLLTEVLENAVRAVGAGDVSHVAHELHELHAAKDATEAAVKDGSYRLPKNSDQVPTFLAMDDAFHKQLEAMVRASRANDVPAMAQAIGNTLNVCNSCHVHFRDP